MSPLRRRMIEDMQIRNLSPHTQRAYVEQVIRLDRKSTRLNSSHRSLSRMPSSA